ncbi:MAG: hypothetical protein R3B52_00510 [Candidatus Paceibacterota bacterium]
MKSLRYKKKKQHPLAVALCLLFLSFAAFVVVKNASAVELNGQADFRLSIQLNDKTCGQQNGTPRSAGFLSQGAGYAQSDWATDSNGFDPDCARLGLESQGGNTVPTTDFRVCIQVSDDIAYSFMSQRVVNVNQVGIERCTPYVSEGGGWSEWAYDGGTGSDRAFDPDAVRLRIEANSTPLEGIEIDNMRFGIQLSDDQCTGQFGAPEFTPWLVDVGMNSASEHWSNWAKDGGPNYKDPDCVRIKMEVITNPVGNNEDEELPDTPACSDGIDNDSDGSADYPSDPGCASADDNSEADNAQNACENGEDDDGDGLVDMNDPGCASPSDDDETDPIACNFAANPTSLVKGIGTSKLTWDCRHSDGTVMTGTVSIVDDNAAQTFAGLGNNLGAAGSVNVAPEQTTRFTLSPSLSGLIPETATVRIENSSFDEDIP